MSRKWVVNASPLIVLSRISKIRILTELCSNLVIPDAVANEINAGQNDDSAKLWISSYGLIYVATLSSSDSRVVTWDLGSGNGCAEFELFKIRTMKQSSMIVQHETVPHH